MQVRKEVNRAPSPDAEMSRRSLLIVVSLLVLSLTLAATSESQSPAHDPGPRAGSVAAGGPVSGLSPAQSAAFSDGMSRFVSVDSVSGTLAGEPDAGLGPRFNSNSCGSCHAQPTTGGSSPSATAYPYVGPNPQVAVATLDGADNALPYFVTPNGPVREARFVNVVGSNGRLTNTPDGGVHDLFTITGRTDATNAPGQFSSSQTCSLAQPNFNQMRALNNIIFRVPTPLFGAGMVENIPDEVIENNMNANSSAKSALGISGQPNRSGNDGTITRFGWKAQNKSLELFAGEAYNVEQGVTNEMFQNERAGPGEAYPRTCFFNATPEDSTNFGDSSINTPSDLVAFAAFMRFLDQPAPSANTPGGAQSINNGRSLFTAAGCALCHTPQLPTGPSSLVSGLSQVQANLFSDLLVHHMGTGLADGVSQGAAGPDQFRTSPLWGLGQRVFFLHDGRTSDLMQAIQQHASSGSEANAVIHRFNQLTQSQQQDLLNFLRSL